MGLIGSSVFHIDPAANRWKAPWKIHKTAVDGRNDHVFIAAPVRFGKIKTIPNILVISRQIGINHFTVPYIFNDILGYILNLQREEYLVVFIYNEYTVYRGSGSVHMNIRGITASDLRYKVAPFSVITIKNPFTGRQGNINLQEYTANSAVQREQYQFFSLYGQNRC